MEHTVQLLNLQFPYMLLIVVLSAWALGDALRWSAELTELGNFSVRVDQRDSSKQQGLLPLQAILVVTKNPNPPKGIETHHLAVLAPAGDQRSPWTSMVNRHHQPSSSRI